nr:hypothetical protein [Petrotoga mobilis]
MFLQLLKYPLKIWEEKYITKTNKLSIIIPNQCQVFKL